MAAPAFAKAEVVPFTQAEVETLWKAAEFCGEAQTRCRQRFVMRRRTALRDRAIILILLDTGLRASELCALNRGDVDDKTGKLTPKQGQRGRARVIYYWAVAHGRLLMLFMYLKPERAVPFTLTLAQIKVLRQIIETEHP